MFKEHLSNRPQPSVPANACNACYMVSMCSLCGLILNMGSERSMVVYLTLFRTNRLTSVFKELRI